MKKQKINEIQRFTTLFGYGSFRSYKEGIEVRVKDLDAARATASKIISENALQVVITNVDPVLKSFVVSLKESI